jgi:hypothetical protein
LTERDAGKRRHRQWSFSDDIRVGPLPVPKRLPSKRDCGKSVPNFDQAEQGDVKGPFQVLVGDDHEVFTDRVDSVAAAVIKTKVTPGFGEHRRSVSFRRTGAERLAVDPL